MPKRKLGQIPGAGGVENGAGVAPRGRWGCRRAWSSLRRQAAWAWAVAAGPGTTRAACPHRGTFRSQVLLRTLPTPILLSSKKANAPGVCAASPPLGRCGGGHLPAGVTCVVRAQHLPLDGPLAKNQKARGGDAARSAHLINYAQSAATTFRFWFVLLFCRKKSGHASMLYFLIDIDTLFRTRVNTKYLN